VSSLKKVLKEHTQEIAAKWGHRLHARGGSKYRTRPPKELLLLTAEATDANYEALINKDFSKLDSFIEKITKLRLESGFTLSEVQKAFDLYRVIVAPIIAKKIGGIALSRAIARLNYCLSYTITRFSDYFQSLHEKAVRDYAQTLEIEVAERTRELSESEAKYRVLVEDINDGYFINHEGKIVFANRAFCEMHGYSVKEVIGEPYLKFVAPGSIEKVRSFHDKRLQFEEAPEQYIYDRLHKDGRTLATENKVKVMYYAENYAAAGICRDITERTKMEERIRESERLAHIGQLTTSLAHELRNPLSSIKMTIQMLLETKSLDRDNSKALKISAKEIVKLERILSEMLDFARPVKLAKEPVSIEEVIQSCLELLETRIKEHGIILQYKTMNHVPFQLLDRSKMEQVIINILLNAIEVLPRRGTISIAVRLHNRNKPMVSVEISDNGPGVHTDDLPYIFDPFFSKKPGGTGLGLSNVKKIVEAHGGKVSAFNRRKRFCLVFHVPLETNHE
jgi:PAS domain S-box-containing protein